MEKVKLGYLADALDGAGFEIISLKEETPLRMLLEHGVTSLADIDAVEDGPTGVVRLEIRAVNRDFDAFHSEEA